MARIFISYRREDSAGYAGRICAWLKKSFGEDEVFMDVDGIEPGDDFAAIVERRIRSAELVFVVIGKQWSASADRQGRPRLSQPDDLVRVEIVTAIERGIRVVPILVSGATMPDPAGVPDPLIPLTRLNSFEVSDQFFEDSMIRLAEFVQRWGIEPGNGVHAQLGCSRNTFKVCLVGTFGVGKTSLVRRFVESQFSESYLTTISVQISKKEVMLGPARKLLMIWDLAGEEEGRAISQSHFRGVNGVILVADGCRSSSLDSAVDLRKRVLEAQGTVPAVLAVNKVDLYSEWQVDMKTLEAFGRMGLTTFTTSAKTGKAVEDLFLHLTRQMVAVAHIPRDHE